MTHPDLFTDLGPVDFGKPVVSLARARELVAAVEELEGEDWETFNERCHHIQCEARRLGAYSVHRAVWWLTRDETLDRYGHDASMIRVERAAHRWLARLEAERTRIGGAT